MKISNVSDSTLYDYCRWGKESKVIKVLNMDNAEINALYSDGVFFLLAISKGNVEICQALIKYFEEKQYPIKDSKYEAAKTQLIEVLENITYGLEPSTEMRQVLSPYIDLEASDNDSLANESDLSDIIMIHNTTSNTVIHKSCSMKNLNTGFNSIYNLNPIDTEDDYEVHSAGETNHDLSL